MLAWDHRTIVAIALNEQAKKKPRTDLTQCFILDDLPTRETFLKNSSKAKDERTLGRGCPLCDSSVYPYCDYKIFHDACWWDRLTFLRKQVVSSFFHSCGLRAPQCQLNQCSHLHANSCAEHQLIARCCCYNRNLWDKRSKPTFNSLNFIFIQK